MTEKEARRLAGVIDAETRLPTLVVGSGDEYRVDIVVEDTGRPAVREVYTLWDELDWPWIREKLSRSAP